MKPYIRGRISLLTKCVLLLFFSSVPSCTSTSVMRIEGNDFKKNLLGRWDGNWSYQAGRSGRVNINITKIDGNKVHLTGYSAGGSVPDTDEVYGRIENSTLLLTWPTAWRGGCKDELRMIRDDSDNLILDGSSKCVGLVDGKVRLKKIE